MTHEDHGPGSEREPARVGAPAEPENGERSGDGNGGDGNGGNGGNGNGGKSGNSAAERPALSSRVGPRVRGRQGSSSSTPAEKSGAVRKLRDLVATAVLTVAVLAALVLALGAVLVGLKANVENPIVSGVLDLANRLDGPFADIFTFTSVIKQTLVNWGIAAAVYLIAGRIVERVIRP